MNEWYVITGGTSSGKSTLIAELEKLGHKTIPEMARVVIDEGKSAGKPTTQIRADERAFQDIVMERKEALEKDLDNNLLTFFDRGIHDTEAYFRYYGWKLPQNFKSAHNNARYKKVFLLEQLPSFEKDYARTEEKGFSDKISRLLHETYQAYGMKPVRVPVLPIPERVQFILDNL